MDRQPDDPSKEHRETMRLEMFKAVVAFEHAALKPLIWLNGAGALAVMTYLGTLEPGSPMVSLARLPLALFGIGLAFGVLAGFCGYWSQNRFYQAGGAEAKMPRGWTKKRYEHAGEIIRLCAYAASFLSLCVFLTALFSGLSALEAQP